MLNERLSELGGAVERSREVLAIQQEADTVIASVKATGTDGAGEEQIRARWLIGCDGAYSKVRKLQAISFEGRTAPDEFLLGDVDLDWNRTRETTHGWLTRDGLFAVFPLPGGQWRLFATLRHTPGGEVPQASVDVFQRLMMQYTGDNRTTISNPTWMSNFRIRYCVAREYRKGRVFLAGDAAHIHSPFGGQGINIGIQDVYNLAWKLALVLQRKVPDSLLDTYQWERMPIARYVLQGSEGATGILVTRNPALRLLRDHVVRPLLSMDIIQRRLAQAASELNMNYRRSSLSQSSYENRANVSGWLTWSRAPHAGDRSLPGECLSYPSGERTDLLQALHGTEGHLLLFAGHESSDKVIARLAALASRIEALLAGSVKTHLILAEDEKPAQIAWHGSILLDPQGKLHTLYGARSYSLYFIRPDGYIGFRSQPAREELLTNYLSKIFSVTECSAPAALRTSL